MIRKLFEKLKKLSRGGRPAPVSKPAAGHPPAKQARAPIRTPTAEARRLQAEARKAAHPAPRPAPAHTQERGVSHSATGEEGEAPSRPRRRRSRGGRGRSDGETRPATEGPRGDAVDRPVEARAVPPEESRAPWDPATHTVEPAEGKTRFHDLNLRPELMHALADLKFQYCTPVQAQSLPAALEGRDVAGRAQTGTGKTAAFLLTIFQRFLANPRPADAARKGTPRALILAPTRELAMQIERDAQKLCPYARAHVVVLYGGEEMEKQRRRLAAGPVDVVVATPGRLLDLCQRREVNLGAVEILVIDEADRMLDMGFIPDVRRIVGQTPPKDRRQTLLYSATLSEPVMKLAAAWMRDYVRVDIEPENVAVDTVDQIIYVVTNQEKLPLLYHVLKQEERERLIIFVNRRDTAEWLTAQIRNFGFDCELLSGAVNQSKRTRTLEEFREGRRVRILVATDVAGRGLHVEGISHVINYNTPIDPEDYVHRIGRTGRAGASGTSITFACEEESFYLPAIETYLGRELKYTYPEEAMVRFPEGVRPLPPERKRGPSRFGGGRPPPRGRRPGGRR